MLCFCEPKATPATLKSIHRHNFTTYSVIVITMVGCGPQDKETEQ